MIFICKSSSRLSYQSAVTFANTFKYEQKYLRNEALINDAKEATRKTNELQIPGVQVRCELIIKITFFLLQCIQIV